jgi:hypothetical protein
VKRASILAVTVLMAVAVLVWTLVTGHRPTAQDQTEPQAEVKGSAASAPKPTMRKNLPPAFDESAGLRAKVEQLTKEREAEKRTAALKCATTISSSCPFLSPSTEILREMARCGVVRMDLPSPPRSDGEPPSEVDDVTRRFWAQTHESFGEFHRELVKGVDVPKDFDKLVMEIQSSISPQATIEITRRIARERAGLEPQPRPQEIALLATPERFWRRLVDLGDQYEMMLAQTIGPARAKSLRAERDGWSRQQLHAGPCDPAQGEL